MSDKYADLRESLDNGLGAINAAEARLLLADLDAANARADEAEAMCEWLAGKVSDRDALAATRDGGTFRSPEEWYAAAREAVRHE